MEIRHFPHRRFRVECSFACGHKGCTGDSRGRPPSLCVEDPVDMFAPLLKKLFGSKNEREVKRLLKAVQSVNAFEEKLVALSDEQLRA